MAQCSRILEHNLTTFYLVPAFLQFYISHFSCISLMRRTSYCCNSCIAWCNQITDHEMNAKGKTKYATKSFYLFTFYHLTSGKCSEDACTAYPCCKN